MSPPTVLEFGIGAIIDVAPSPTSRDQILVATEIGQVHLVDIPSARVTTTWHCHGGQLRVGWVAGRPIAWKTDRNDNHVWLLSADGSVRGSQLPSSPDLELTDTGFLVASRSSDLTYYEPRDDGSFFREVRQVPRSGKYEPGSLTTTPRGAVALLAGGHLHLQLQEGGAWHRPKFGAAFIALAPSGQFLAAATGSEGTRLNVYTVQKGTMPAAADTDLRVWDLRARGIEWTPSEEWLLLHADGERDVRALRKDGTPGAWSISATRPRAHGVDRLVTTPSERDRLVFQSLAGAPTRIWIHARATRSVQATFDIDGAHNFMRGDAVLLFARQPRVRPIALYEDVSGPRKDQWPASLPPTSPAVCRLVRDFEEPPESLVEQHRERLTWLANTTESLPGGKLHDVSRTFDVLFAAHLPLLERMRLVFQAAGMSVTTEPVAASQGVAPAPDVRPEPPRGVTPQTSTLPLATQEQIAVLDAALSTLIAHEASVTIPGRELRFALGDRERGEKDKLIASCVPALIERPSEQDYHLLTLDGLLRTTDDRPARALSAMLGLLKERYGDQDGRRQRVLLWSDVRRRGGFQPGDFRIAWLTYWIGRLGEGGSEPTGSARATKGSDEYEYSFAIHERDLETMVENATPEGWAAIQRALLKTRLPPVALSYQAARSQITGEPASSFPTAPNSGLGPRTQIELARPQEPLVATPSGGPTSQSVTTHPNHAALADIDAAFAYQPSGSGSAAVVEKATHLYSCIKRHTSADSPHRIEAERCNQLPIGGGHRPIRDAALFGVLRSLRHEIETGHQTPPSKSSAENTGEAPRMRSTPSEEPKGGLRPHAFTIGAGLVTAAYVGWVLARPYSWLMLAVAAGLLASVVIVLLKIVFDPNAFFRRMAWTCLAGSVGFSSLLVQVDRSSAHFAFNFGTSALGLAACIAGACIFGYLELRRRNEHASGASPQPAATVRNATNVGRDQIGSVQGERVSITTMNVFGDGRGRDTPERSSPGPSSTVDGATVELLAVDIDDVWMSSFLERQGNDVTHAYDRERERLIKYLDVAKRSSNEFVDAELQRLHHGLVAAIDAMLDCYTENFSFLGREKEPQFLLSVKFDGRERWLDDYEARLSKEVQAVLAAVQALSDAWRAYVRVARALHPAVRGSSRPVA